MALTVRKENMVMETLSQQNSREQNTENIERIMVAMESIAADLKTLVQLVAKESEESSDLIACGEVEKGLGEIL